jgi:tetratricopeptide (TPR) repeat protein
MASVSKLATQALAALNAGQPAEAAQLFAQVLQRDGEHRDALFYLANYMFQSGGQLAEATELLRRYIHLEPSHSGPRRLLGEIFEQQGELAAALTLYRQAVETAPETGVPYLYLAALHQRQGRNNTAAQIASRAFELDNSLHFVPNDETSHSGARERAARMLKVMGEVLSRHHRSAAKTDRIKAMRWCATDDSGKDDRTKDHNPFLIDLPGVTKSPYLDSPAATALQAAAPEIVAEIMAGLNPANDGVEQAPLHLGAGIESPGWKAVHFWRAGEAVAETVERFPKTSALLRTMPLSQVNSVPAYAWLSILQPGTEIPTHFGASSAHVTLHLGIDVPDGNCVLDVIGEERTWQSGEAFAFMDSFAHSSWNHGDRPRVVLVTQAAHPDLTAAEVDDLQHVLDERMAWFKNRASS